MLGTLMTGLIPCVKSNKKEGHAVFFTAVNPMFVDQHKEFTYDLMNPGLQCTKVLGTNHPKFSRLV